MGALLATLALAGSAGATVLLEIVPQGGGIYLVELTVGEEGLASLQFDITSTSGVPDVGSSAALGFSVPSSDPACTLLSGSCHFSASGPFENPANPTGMNGFAVFVTDPSHALQGAPQAQPFVIAGIVFSNAGSEGIVSFGPGSPVCGTGSGVPFVLGIEPECTVKIIPEPATASLLALGLLGLGLARRRR